MNFYVKNFMLRALTFGVVLLASAAVQATDRPKLIAVEYYADWCSSCKILVPQVEKARAQGDLDMASVLFVRMDLTNPLQRSQADLLAHALGVEAAYNANGGKTGILDVIDFKTKKVLFNFNKEATSSLIVQKIRAEIESK